MNAIWATVTNLTTMAPWPVWLLGVAETALVAYLVTRLIRRRGLPTRIDENRLARTLLIAAMLFCALVLAAFVIGTYEGSTAFARHYLGWSNWRQIIPWGALDAAGFGFGLFVIRAVVLCRSPVRPRRVVYLCAGFSSLLQMLQGGQDHHWQAGLFLAFIAAMGAMVLHTVVDQLRDEQDEADWHRSPPFGIRWLTWPTNTLCAWLAWINHPAAPGTKPTVGNALDNLTRVRDTKTTRAAERLTADLTFPRLAAIIPGRRTKVYGAAITGVRAEHEQKIAELSERNAEQITNLLSEQTALTERADLLATELDRTRAEIPEQIRAAVQSAIEQTERAVREQVAREARQRAEQRPVEQPRPARTERTEPAREQRKSAGHVARLRGDDEIANSLWEAYREQMEQTGQALSRYRVEQDGRCSGRQADRVLVLLADRWSAATDEQTEQARTEQTEDGTDRPLGDALVGASA